MGKILAKPKLGPLSSWQTTISSESEGVLFWIEKKNHNEIQIPLTENQSHVRKETESLTVYI